PGGTGRDGALRRVLTAPVGAAAGAAREREARR
ncbi:MAG: hypothetical protein AVDCRST_MAG53-2076, partial [uncultured Solirubrobacteraceae bacterium]